MKKQQQRLEVKIVTRKLKIPSLSETGVKQQGMDLSALSGEKRMVEGMPPDVKKFYLEFQKNNPGSENEYYRKFVKMKQQENKKRLKEAEEQKSAAERLSKSTSQVNAPQ